MPCGVSFWYTLTIFMELSYTMIELQNIKKTYNPRRRNATYVLNDVSFALPDRGMGFIVGKSGSGKSTLLNILGGLDSATEGELLIDGNRFSSFTVAEQEHYRNLYVGFIFQDFCLIDGLTVTDNIRLSLDLLGEVNDERVAQLIDEVGLSAEKDRYPRQLSGGQMQRVAIARALAKSPQMILADEPTGNLDSKTAKQILSILKRLSRERLVVVISHNVQDAETYADRIIEIGDGQIVDDVEKNDASTPPLIQGNTITLPRGKALSEDDLKAINEKISEEGVRVVQAQEPFSPTKPVKPAEYKALGKPKKMSFAATMRLTRLLSKGGYVGTALTALILAVLTLLLCFSQSFALFSGDKLIKDAIGDTDQYSFSMCKGYYEDPLNLTLKTDKTIRVTDEDIAAFYEAGYEGNIYPLYITNLPFAEQWGSSPPAKGNIAASILTYKSPYAQYANGVLVTNEAFVAKKYGQDGKLTLLAGAVDEESNNKGVVISDYAADSLLYYQPKLSDGAINPYQSVINVQKFTRTNIVAVFETGYRERYADLLAEYDAILQISDEAERNQAIEDLLATDAFDEFSKEVNNYLGIGYYFGEDYNEKILTSLKLSNNPSFHNTDIYNNGRLVVDGSTAMYGADDKLKPGELMIGATYLNSWLGTSYAPDGSDFVPVELTLVGYANGAKETDPPLYTHNFTVVRLAKAAGSGLSVSKEDYKMLHSYDHYAYALYFDNPESAISIYDSASALGFYTNNTYAKSINTVKGIVEIFQGIFVYVALGIAFVALVLIISFSLRSLRRKMREIGILRALGANTSQISLCFILQMISLWLCIVLLSFALFPLLVSNANALLVNNMAQFLENPAIANLTVLEPTPLSLLTVLLVFLPVLLLSLSVPMLYVRKLKPIKIIRTAD